MKYLSCHNNAIDELNVFGLTELELLDCSGNAITEIDVSASSLLKELYCVGNRIREFDLSNNPLLKLDSLAAVGDGTVGYYYNGNYDYGYAEAVPENDCRFIGWFDIEDNELSTAVQLNIRNLEHTAAVLGVFTSTCLLGDADGNGSVELIDAIIIMRYLMNIINGTGLHLENIDVDCNGTVNALDALAVLRISMNA